MSALEVSAWPRLRRRRPAVRQLPVEQRLTVTTGVGAVDVFAWLDEDGVAEVLIDTPAQSGRVRVIVDEEVYRV